MLVEGFDEMEGNITAYNAAYYPKHLEALGFVKDADWVEMEIKVPDKLDERIVKVSNGLMRRGNLHEFKFTKMKQVLPRVERKSSNLLNEGPMPGCTARWSLTSGR